MSGHSFSKLTLNTDTQSSLKMINKYAYLNKGSNKSSTQRNVGSSQNIFIQKPSKLEQQEFIKYLNESKTAKHQRPDYEENINLPGNQQKVIFNYRNYMSPQQNMPFKSMSSYTPVRPANQININASNQPSQYQDPPFVSAPQSQVDSIIQENQQREIPNYLNYTSPEQKIMKQMASYTPVRTHFNPLNGSSQNQSPSLMGSYNPQSPSLRGSYNPSISKNQDDSNLCIIAMSDIQEKIQQLENQVVKMNVDKQQILDSHINQTLNQKQKYTDYLNRIQKTEKNIQENFLILYQENINLKRLAQKPEKQDSSHNDVSFHQEVRTLKQEIQNIKQSKSPNSYDQLKYDLEKQNKLNQELLQKIDTLQKDLDYKLNGKDVLELNKQLIQQQQVNNELQNKLIEVQQKNNQLCTYLETLSKKSKQSEQIHQIAKEREEKYQKLDEKIEQIEKNQNIELQDQQQKLIENEEKNNKHLKSFQKQKKLLEKQQQNQQKEKKKLESQLEKIQSEYKLLLNSLNDMMHDKKRLHMDDSIYHYNKESFSPQVQLQEGDMISRQLAEAGAELTNCNKIYEDLINKSSKEQIFAIRCQYRTEIIKLQENIRQNLQIFNNLKSKQQQFLIQ